VDSLKSSFRRPQVYYTLLLLALMALGLGLRLFDLTDQPIDFNPTRQLRGAIIARGTYYQLNPVFNPAVRQQAQEFSASTGKYEPPILETLAAVTYLLAGKEIMWVARIYSSLFWIIGGVALFALARRMTLAALANKPEPNAQVIAFWTAFLSLAYYLVLPFSVQASRSFQPDPGMVMWIILSAYALYRWSEERTWKWAILAGVSSGMAVLTKAVAFYIEAVAMAAMIIYTFDFLRSRPVFTPLLKILGSLQVWAMGILMIGPTLAYYLGRGDRASQYFSSWTLALAHLLLSPSLYLHWLNLIRELMGLVPLLLGVVGLLLARRRNLAILVGLWGGYILYGFLLPYQISTHNYYQIQLIPILALSITPVAQAILERLFKLNTIWRLAFAGGILAAMTYYSWQAVIPLYSENYRNEPAYWQTIASYLPANGKILALTQDYGYRLMYYGWRKVTLWPNRGEQELSKLRGSNKDFQEYFQKRIADKSYFLITAFNQFNGQPNLKQFLDANFPVLARSPGYLIYDLTHPKSNTPGSP